jgi:FtsZ-interacting cell division protein ZipA
MLSLRWILMLLGLMFIAGLSWRELRRSRQDAAESESRRRRVEPTMEPTREPLAPEPPAVTESAALRELPIVQWRVAQVPADSDEVLAGAEPPPPDSPPLDTETVAVAASSDATPPRPSIAEWPPEDIRRICSLRLLPRRQERFSGRALRQGLLSAGFQHGDLGIFHLPGSDERAMISVASLARPGLLDPGMMDFQRFSGLQLFTVLPGRLPARPALQQLFSVAQELAGRVDGSVRNESGELLDDERMAALQQQFADDAPLSHSGN